MKYCPATGGKSPRSPIHVSPSARSCRARRRPSACRTPRGIRTSRQASLVWTGEPRAMHVCSARTQPLAGNRLATQRNPEAPNCTGTQPSARNPRATPCCARRHLSRPFVTARVQEHKVFGVIGCYSIAALELTGSSTSPSPSPSLSPYSSHSASGGTFCLSSHSHL